MWYLLWYDFKLVFLSFIFSVVFRLCVSDFVSAITIGRKLLSPLGLGVLVLIDQLRWPEVFGYCPPAFAFHVWAQLALADLPSVAPDAAHHGGAVDPCHPHQIRI